MLVSCTINLPEEVRKQIETETSALFKLHPEYLWYDIADYRIILYSWPDVENDLIGKLSEKLHDLLFEQKSFTLYGLKYTVKIGNHIDILLHFQEENIYRALIGSISSYFSPSMEPQAVPFLPIARYKIPSKQQYSHLKNQLAKLETKVEFSVEGISLTKTTDFGNGIKKYEDLSKIGFVI